MASLAFTLPNTILAAPFPASEKARIQRQVQAHATHKLKLVTPKKTVQIKTSSNETILDAAEEIGLDLPYTCRAGACSSCVGKVISGTVDQSDNSFLDDEEMAKGYVLTCIAFPTSDVVIQTHKEAQLMKE